MEYSSAESLDTIKMKSSTYKFRDQVNAVTEVFKSWNECEQSVVLYSLLKILNATQAKFLMQVIEHSFIETADLLLLERNANEPAYVAALRQQSKENAVASLLALLPMLKAGNQEAKDEYIKILPKIFTHSFENGCHIEESRQLLSYSLIHPCMNSVERAQFKPWLSHLEKHFEYGGTQYQSKVMVGVEEDNVKPTSTEIQQEYLESKSDASYNDNRYLLPDHRAETEHIPLYMAYSNPAAFAAAPQDNSVPSQLDMNSLNHTSMPPNMQGGHRKLMRSASVVPPTNGPPTSANVSDWLNKHHSEMISQPQQRVVHDNLLRDFPSHAPISPQSSNASSGSDNNEDDDHCQRNTFLEENSGMRDVPIWLRSLRLHKYAYLFQQMTYEQMLNLTEEWLEQHNVTKGARQKIVLSINKLRKRPSQMQAMEKEIMGSGNIKQALTDLKTIMITPIKSYSSINKNKMFIENVNREQNGTYGDHINECDLPGQLTRIFGKVCTQLLVTAWPDDESFALYLQLLDKSIAHEAFTSDQKKKLNTWKQRIQKNWRPPPPKLNLERQREVLNAMFPPAVLPAAAAGNSAAAVMQRPGTVNAQAASVLRAGAQLQQQQHQQLAPGAAAASFDLPPSRSQQQQQQQAAAVAAAAQWAFAGLPTPMSLGGQLNGPGRGGNSMPLYRMSSLNTAAAAAFAANPPVMTHSMKQALSRTHLAPSAKTTPYTNITMPRAMADMTMAEPGLTARLESLCLSMTEHALGGNSHGDKS